MTICDQNGFKEKDVLKQSEMNPFVIMNIGIKMWPNTSNQVDQSWKNITFEFQELVERIGIRHSGGKYCYMFCNEQDRINSKCCQNIFDVVPVSTIHFGRCYNLHPKKSSIFYAFDNIVIIYKRDFNLFLHGSGQEIGIIGNFYPVKPKFIQLQKYAYYKLDFQAKELRIDEDLDCNPKITEEDYYSCLKNVISDNFKTIVKKGERCTVPMLSYVLRRYCTIFHSNFYSRINQSLFFPCLEIIFPFVPQLSHLPKLQALVEN